MPNCPLCNSIAETIPNPNVPDVKWINCEICGEYEISDMVICGMLTDRIYGDRKYILSGLARQWSERSRRITILSDNIQTLLDSVPERNPIESMDMLLLFVKGKTKYTGEFVRLVPRIDYPIVFGRNEDELLFLKRKLCDMGYLEHADNDRVRLSIEGWKYVIGIDRRLEKSDQAFVAMWFDPSMDEIWENGIKQALTSVGYRPMRIDQEEHNEKICDIIISEIRKSGLLIADVTGQRQGVYYEAGFAAGLGIPVIWTCINDEVDSIHFDTRQYNHIVWDNAGDLKQKLINRIEATVPLRTR